MNAFEIERAILHADLCGDYGRAYQLRGRWWVQFGQQVTPWPTPNDTDPERPLRVGYVSGDINFHSATTSFGPIILSHSSRVLPYIYSSTPPQNLDETSLYFMANTYWRNVCEYPNKELAHLIQEDAIDVLIDLSGFTSHNRLLVFCMRPAPVQLHGWGYAVPTRFPCYDAMLTDRVHVPLAERALTEPMADLPCVLPWADRALPEVSALPCLTRAPMFGCFNRFDKIDERALLLWRRVLDAVPGARLTIKSQRISTAQAQMAHAIFGYRLTLLGRTDAQQHVAALRKIDVSLDPLAQSGGVSALDSIQVGAPVITLPARHAATRVAAAVNHALGLNRFTASCEGEYVQLAVEAVTSRRAELAATRAALPSVLKSSALAVGYVPQVEAVYRRLWQAYCRERN